MFPRLLVNEPECLDRFGRNYAATHRLDVVNLYSLLPAKERSAATRRSGGSDPITYRSK